MADQGRVREGSSEAVRAEIESTRARMSATLDEIEDVLVEKKARWRERLDIGARLREKPLQAAGIVFGAGLLLGFLTGGTRIDRRGIEEAEKRADLWEGRARRLLDIARVQEEEIDDLEDLAYRASDSYEYDSDEDELDDEADDVPTRWSGLREAVAGRVAAAADRGRGRFRGQFGG